MSSNPKRPSRPSTRRKPNPKAGSGRPASRARRPVGSRPVRRRRFPTPPPGPPPIDAGESGERLQKVLAHAGVASRRAAEQMMLAGRVWVDGRPATTLGMRVDPKRSKIEVDGRRVHVSDDHEYVLLNKPEGYVTTLKDPQGRPTVVDLVKSDRRLYPVGRLDVDTQGLLLLTDDGELTHRLSHPRYEVQRTYLVEVKGVMPPAAVRRLADGVRLDDGPARARTARVIRSAASRTQVELVLTEGRKREVRRMLEAVGFPVIKLVRTRFGTLTLTGVKSGRTRRLSAEEIGELHKLVGL